MLRGTARPGTGRVSARVVTGYGTTVFGTQDSAALTVHPYFTKLGAHVDEAWRARDYDERAFPGIAERALRELPPAESVRFGDLVRWLLATPTLPAQNVVLGGEFGEPPVMLYAGHGFFIEALFWLDARVGYHQHQFSGAFTPLVGSSLHTTYAFDARDRVNDRLLLGELHYQHAELLDPGDVRPILAGREFIHATYHLDRPTVTIVVRTNRELAVLPQYTYRPPHVALAVQDYQELTVRRVQLLTLLQQAQRTEFHELARELLARSDLLTTFVALEAIWPAASADERGRFLEVARARHGARLDPLVPVFREATRIASLQRLGGLLQRPEETPLRLLVALAMNVPRQRDILALLAPRAPGRDPVDAIVEGLAAIAAIKDPRSGRHALGAPFDDAWRLMCRCLVEGLDADQTRARFAREYAADDVAARGPLLARLGDALRANPLVGPFIPGPPARP